MMNYEFGDVLLVDFSQSGIDPRKRRPALVVLDIGDADVVLAPITTKERSGQGDYKLRDWSVSGLLRGAIQISRNSDISLNISFGRGKEGKEYIYRHNQHPLIFPYISLSSIDPLLGKMEEFNSSIEWC